MIRVTSTKRNYEESNIKFKINTDSVMTTLLYSDDRTVVCYVEVNLQTAVDEVGKVKLLGKI